MREILYRAISMATGEHWIYGHPRHYAHNPHTEKWTMYDPDTGIETDIDEETLGQYTGQNAACKDSQGQICRKQQVFEHDILADQNGKIIGCVKFTEERGWMVGVESLYDYTDRYDEKEALIIGNIHDNPALLKGGEE